MYKFRVFTNGKPKKMDFVIYADSERAAWCKICELAMEFFKPEFVTHIERLI